MAFTDQLLAQIPLVFLDLETTGLAVYQGHRVCEVGLIRERNGVEEGRLSVLVDPGRPLDARAAAVNGLSSELLAGAPPFARVADQVLALLDGSLLVAHNAPFDLAFLNQELILSGRAPLTNPVLDTLGLARRLLRRPSYSLTALAGELGLAPPSHRALDDVLTLRMVFAFLSQLLAEQGLREVGDILRFERGLRPGDPEIEAPELLAHALYHGRRLRIVYSSRSTPEPTLRLIRPLALSRETSGIFVRAYCFLRNDLRAFALDKIVSMEMEA